MIDVLSNQIGQLGPKNRRYLGRPAPKGIYHLSVSCVKDNGRNGAYSQFLLYQWTNFFGMSEGHPYYGKLCGSIANVDSFRNGLKLWGHGLAGLAPRAKYLYYDELIGILFQYGSEGWKYIHYGNDSSERNKRNRITLVFCTIEFNIQRHDILCTEQNVPVFFFGGDVIQAISSDFWGFICRSERCSKRGYRGGESSWRCLHVCVAYPCWPRRRLWKHRKSLGM